jgi:thioredoxin-dependent peroxiredoxin
MTQTHLSLNVSAPQFTLIDIYDRPTNLADYLGKKVFIGFFRHAGCPFCNLRVHSLVKMREGLLKKNMEMIFFFESKKETMLRSMFHQEVSPIPLIADPEKKWYGIYGIENSFSKSAYSHLTTFIQTAIKAQRTKVPIHAMASDESFSTMPAEFMLDENLVIRKLHYSQTLTDRLSLQVIEDFANGTIR